MSTASKSGQGRFAWMLLATVLVGIMAVTTGCMTSKQTCSAYQEVPCE